MYPNVYLKIGDVQEVKMAKQKRVPVPIKRSPTKGKLSLYPLELETALASALKTGTPPSETEKKKSTAKPR